MSTHETSRRTFLKTATAALAGATAAAAETSSQPTATANRSGATPVKRRKPLNVLFFMSDDMRPELACYNSRFHAHSPNIDALSASGVRFDRNYCQFPLCNPSRSSLFTGHLPRETGVLGNGIGITQTHPEWVTLPHLFRQNGYLTLRSGKLFHAGLDDHAAWTDFDGDVESLHPTQTGTRMDIPHARIPLPDGTVPPFPTNARATHSDEILVLDGNGEGAGDFLVADRAIQYLQRAAANPAQPFFIGCGFSKPHSPPQAPQRFFDMYDPAQITLPPDFAAWPTVPPGFPTAAIRPKNADLFIGRGASPEEARQVIRAYLASISWADWNLGRVLAELDRLNLRDSTLVVFVADHGYQLGEKGKWSKAGSLFEAGTRVPLILDVPAHAMPGARGNGRPCLHTVQSLDLYRTVCELAGLEPPSHVLGTSLVPLLQNPQARWDRPAYSIWSEDGETIHGTAIRTPQYRYAEFKKPTPNARPEEYSMLFDVHADPMELTNIAADPRHASAREHLSRLVNQYSYPTAGGPAASNPTERHA